MVIAAMKLKDTYSVEGKVITNLDSILKSRDITLSTKVRLVKAMVFPVVMYGCESWTIKKAECRRNDAFELWCWGKLLRVPWTARRSNQSIIKEISPGCSLEGRTKLKFQYFGPLMQRADSFEKTLMLGKTEGQRRRGWQRKRWLDGITDTMGMGLGDFGSWWWTGRPGVLQLMGSQRVGHEWATELNWTEQNWRHTSTKLMISSQCKLKKTEKGATFSIYDSMFINVRPMYFLSTPQVHVSSFEKQWLTRTHLKLVSRLKTRADSGVTQNWIQIPAVTY